MLDDRPTRDFYAGAVAPALRDDSTEDEDSLDQRIREGGAMPATADRTALPASIDDQLAVQPVDTNNTVTKSLLEMREEERY
ncbi:hypothetical protein N5079_22320 [Planotetraspora sp. A-T 1434]|uniref:hypothetical protein n=1 Tax=Planotetraspora sp. A-T 1434 TaxID=2979219 RepID=UPI0021C0BDB7|nr:hypothetical protein [Planotetraspora sp. A-T 1434]MCT9932947.1 hypothetical protein [Planotetraspora sp. A-T 1434]